MPAELKQAKTITITKITKTITSIYGYLHTSTKTSCGTKQHKKESLIKDIGKMKCHL